MKIEKTDKEINFIFPRHQKRSNPYDEKSDFGEYPTFTGLIIHHRKDGQYDEMGFAGTIDMDYKDKPDQVSDFVVMWDGGEEEFRKECEKLQINIFEMEV